MNVLRDRGPGADAKGRSTLNAFIYGLNAWSRDRAEIPLSLALLRSEDSHRSAEVARKSSALLSIPALSDVIGTDVGVDGGESILVNFGPPIGQDWWDYYREYLSPIIEDWSVEF